MSRSSIVIVSVAAVLILLVAIAINTNLVGFASRSTSTRSTGQAATTKSYYCCGPSGSNIKMMESCGSRWVKWKWGASPSTANSCWRTTCDAWCKSNSYTSGLVSSDNNTCVCSKSVTGTASGTTEATRRCSDSDGGKNYASKGITIEGTKSFQDTCRTYTSPNANVTFNDLNEYYCEAGVARSEIYTCPPHQICWNGACTHVGCGDSDGGQNFEVRGVARNMSASGEVIATLGDSCDQQGVLFETYCTDYSDGRSGINFAVHNCSNEGKFCANGACAAAATTCVDTDASDLRYVSVPGNNTAVAGTCTDSIGTHPDDYRANSGNCSTTRYQEYFCVGGYCQLNQGGGRIGNPCLADCTSNSCTSLNREMMCYDTDPSSNLLVKGVVSLLNGTTMGDYCVGSERVDEFNCASGQEISDSILACPSGKTCSDGACI